MKKLNVRLLAILLGIVGVLAVILIAVHYFQQRQHADFFKKKAEVASNTEDLEQLIEAQKYYDRYLSLAPNDNEARAELGLLYIRMAEHDGRFLYPAFRTLEKVVREKASRHDIRRKLVDVAMRMYQFGDAKEHLEVLQNHDPTNGEILELLARCQAVDQDYREAGKSYEAAIQLSPDRLESYVNLAYLIRFHGDEVLASSGVDEDDTDPNEVADGWINQMVEKNPKTAKAYVSRGAYFQRTDRLEEAQKDVTEALRLAPDDEGALLLAVQICLRKGDFDKAREHAESAAKLFPDSPGVYEVLSDIERRAGNPKGARDWLDKGLAATDDDPQLVWQKANMLISDGELESVEPLIEQLRGSNSPYRQQVYISFLQGRLALAQKEWAKARSLFEQIHTDLAQSSPHLGRQVGRFLVECYLKLGRRDLADSLTRELQKAGSGRSTTQSMPLRELLARGQLPAAIAECRELLKRNDAPPTAWIDLAKLLILQNAQNARLPEPQYNWTEVEQVLDKAAELTPDRVEVPLLRASMRLGQNRRDEAVKLLEDATRQDPTRWAIWDRLARLAQEDKDWDRVVELLDKAEKNVAVKTSIYLARGRLAVLRDGQQAVDTLKQLGENVAGMADSEKAFFWSVLAQYCLQSKNLEQAKVFCRKSADIDPSNLQIRLLLFEVARYTTDQAAMKHAVDEIGRIEGNGPHWHYTSATLLAMFNNDGEDKTQDYKKAIAHLVQARRLRPGWSAVPMLRAKIQEEMGEEEKAIDSYLEAVDQGSRERIGMVRLVQLLMKHGREDEAARIIDLRAQQKAGLSLKELLITGTRHLREGDIEQGVADFSRVAEELHKMAEESKDYRRFFSLSRILRRLGLLAKLRKQEAEAKQRFDDAEKALRRATELSPETGQLWIDLVSLLSQADRSHEISNVLDEAKKKMPPDQVALTLAKCYHVLGRLAEAEGHYLNVYQNDKNNKALARLMAGLYLQARKVKNPKKAEENRKKGKTILREMIDGKRPTNENDIPWARRQLAALLSEQRSHRSYHEAMKLIEANLREDPESVPDKRRKARLLSRRPSRTDRRKAQAILEELVRLPQPSHHDRYELARLYYTEEQWNKASRQMQPVLAAKRIEPKWLDFYIRALIRAKEFSGAEGSLARYEKMGADPYRVALLRAQILSGRKRHNEAIRVLRDYVNNASSTFTTRPTRLFRAADALEYLAKHTPSPGREAAVEQYLKQAEAYFREYVQLVPSETMYLVSFLGRYGQFKDALKIAEETSRENKPVNIAISAVGLLVRGNPSPEDIKRVENILMGAIDEHGESIPLLLALAEQRSIQKRYDDAEKLYRTVLAEDPDHIVALNNLAVFLALRGLKLDEAMRMIQRTIELRGSAATLIDSRATVHLAKGQWQKAIDDLSLAISDEPSGTRYFHQAQAYFQGGKKKEARDSLKTADNYGLKVEHLQPLERPAYRQLKEELQ